MPLSLGKRYIVLKAHERILNTIMIRFDFIITFVFRANISATRFGDANDADE
jgi:hypothetical protein